MALLPKLDNLDNIDDDDDVLVQFVKNCEKIYLIPPNQIATTTNNMTVTSNIQNFKTNPTMPTIPQMYFPNCNVTINYNYKQ